MTGAGVKAPDDRPAVPEFKDIAKIILVAGAAAPAWLLPETAWIVIARAIAPLRLLFGGGAVPPDVATVARGLRATGTARTPKALRYAWAAAENERVFQALREHAPWGWRPTIRLDGADHIAAARAAGRGVILYVHPTAFHTFIVKKGLAEHGVSCVHLSRPSHGLSSSRFGIRHLNRIVTRMEDRYIARRVVLEDDAPARALRPVIKALAANEVVSITANSAGRCHEIPVFGGVLRLARGAASLGLGTGAPLLPVFSARESDGTYTVEVRAPLPVPDGAKGDPAERAVLSEYARRLETFVARYPEQWMEWNDRTRWRD